MAALDGGPARQRTALLSLYAARSRPSCARVTMAGLVQLNVGGVVYDTSRMTLLGGGGASFFSGLLGDTGAALRGAGSYAPASAVNGRRRKRADADGPGGEDDAPEPLFIDRSGALFAPILEFLRCVLAATGKAQPPACLQRRRQRASAPRVHDARARLRPRRSATRDTRATCAGRREACTPGACADTATNVPRTGSLPAAYQDDRAALSDLSKEAAYYLIDPLIKHIAERQRVLGSPLAEVWGVKLPSAQGHGGGMVVAVDVPEGREITITRVVRFSLCAVRCVH